MLLSNSQYKLSGIRLSVTYKLLGNEKDALEKAKDICLEQTVEFPGDIVPEGFIRDEIVGRIESFEPYDLSESNSYNAVISYAIETTANELTQLLNVIFGNISIKPGIRVEEIHLPDSFLANFKGPRWGRGGIREILKVEGRPLLFTALKPMGLSAKELAELAYKFALGGIDIIKDDHGISNQEFSPFEERLMRCVEAVDKANRETGRNTIYVPNITAPSCDIISRAKKAKTEGAGGLLISPGLTGFDVMRQIADDDSIALPIFGHPAFQGSYVMGSNGISHYALFGQIERLAGADAVIFPNFGGRFSFSRAECESIAKGTCDSFGHLKSIFPCPAGGMSFSNIPKMVKAYGNDVILLIGGGLFKHGPDIIVNSRYFLDMVCQCKLS